MYLIRPTIQPTWPNWAISHLSTHHHLLMVETTLLTRLPSTEPCYLPSPSETQVTSPPLSSGISSLGSPSTLKLMHWRSTIAINNKPSQPIKGTDRVVLPHHTLSHIYSQRRLSPTAFHLHLLADSTTPPPLRRRWWAPRCLPLSHRSVVTSYRSP
jgi:hypothetical protein